ncbi:MULTISPECIES: methyl-accepting chemotaxis protein [Aliivibrio]|uniref:Methyl-accepting chemotaxis protein n=1 Tax=Aliivibrio finisterrensis TaxID=511998 RepID=A0A4V1Z951_9GAMM|nr:MULTISPECIES: methyl-accepting chemotaxis protein [Aliivibrio]MDD9178521.1 methyl-accepting chemotaxis protein [Aliivibrio sp. A6]RYU53016.1 methyl-accepting chemotaxis protein [Aliivibrio finisterrensis]RYU53412.1 methyl-accepting chemotaxis protein [Aliivibrio finisterrensis]RYU58499.1 methyl-accepting chemotaxis protein [Aliivibrio finisterrensis]RYU65918.1 methyl-accepting chemotaxis protein [Aliivibrio finisterrensis]
MQFSLKNTSIRIQVLLPVILTALALFISLGFTASSLEKEQDIIASNTDSFVFYKDQLAKVDDEVYPLRISAVYAIYDTERREKFTTELRNKVNDINALLDELEARKTFAKEVNLVRTNINNYVQFSHKVIGYLNKKESGQAVSQSYDALISQYRNIGNSMVSSINALSQRVNEFSDIAMKESYEKNTQVKITAGLTILAVFIISMITAWWLSGLIVNPIKKIQLTIRRLAEGDLTVRADVDGDNEIAVLSKDINTTAIQLQTTVEALSRISEDVAAASTELAAVMTDSEANSQKELSEIEQVASAVNELSSTADNVSDNALSADQTARDTTKLAQSGLDIFTQSNQASEDMANSLTDAAVVVNRLKEQSEQINNVVEVIRGVSEQTNLLALNAAIEAARAGESGRGFAVVADEVRLLAARTQESTKEIQTIIESLQEQSGLANDSMQTSIDKLELNKELTAKAGDALVSITESITAINDMNTQVATAAEEQSQVTQDINRNVVNMSELVNQNVTGISQSASASNELSKLAEQQKEQLAFFKL